MKKDEIEADIAKTEAALATAKSATAKLRTLNNCKLWPSCGCKWDSPMCARMKEPAKA